MTISALNKLLQSDFIFQFGGRFWSFCKPLFASAIRFFPSSSMERKQPAVIMSHKTLVTYASKETYAILHSDATENHMMVSYESYLMKVHFNHITRCLRDSHCASLQRFPRLTQWTKTFFTRLSNKFQWS